MMTTADAEKPLRPPRPVVCHGIPLIAAGLLFVGTVLSIWHLFLRGPVMTYGDARSTFFEPAVATEGEAIDLCFTDAAWYRTCPSELVLYYTPWRGPRVDDIPIYSLKVPDKPQRTPAKCRRVDAPELGGTNVDGKPIREGGLGQISGFARSYCTALDRWLNTPIITAFPTIPLTIMRR